MEPDKSSMVLDAIKVLCVTRHPPSAHALLTVVSGLRDGLRRRVPCRAINTRNISEEGFSLSYQEYRIENAEGNIG